MRKEKESKQGGEEKVGSWEGDKGDRRGLSEKQEKVNMEKARERKSEVVRRERPSRSSPPSVSTPLSHIHFVNGLV